jgi:alkyl sulfatase
MGLPEKIDTSAVDCAVRPVAGRIGAEISGITLSGDLEATTVNRIRRALLQYKVLFFRQQHPLTLAGQEAFGRLFGEIIPHPTIPRIEGTQGAFSLFYADASTASNAWHTDDPFLDAYPMAGILTPVMLPSSGGDTMWANTASAYEELPQVLRDLADQLWVIHSNMGGFNAARRHPKAISTAYEAEHPLVRVHPETGERTLVLGFHARQIVGLGRPDSDRLIQIFQDHITRPENTVRWQWAMGDVAFWDNRATQHYGIGDFSEKRQLHRVSLQGDVPISVDGRRSILRRKEEFRVSDLADGAMISPEP